MVVDYFGLLSLLLALPIIIAAWVVAIIVTIKLFDILTDNAYSLIKHIKELVAWAKRK